MGRSTPFDGLFQLGIKDGRSDRYACVGQSRLTADRFSKILDSFVEINHKPGQEILWSVVNR